MDDLVLAVDIGTSSLKASMIDASGVIRANARCRFPQGKRTAAHWTNAWFEAVSILNSQLHSATRNGQRSGHAASRVAAVSVSGNGPTLVSVDQAGNPGPILLWNDNVPANAGPDAAERAGSSLFIPRIHAFRTLYLDAWNNAHFVFSGPEYLLWFLTGNPVTILPESRYLDAYWTPSALTGAGLDPGRLPPFVDTGTIVGMTGSGRAARIDGFRGKGGDLPSGIPVIAGGPDFIVALIGTGTLEPGKACDRAGTSEGLNVCTETAVSFPRVRTLPSVIDGLWNASYLLPETGALFHAWRRSSGLENKAYPDIMREIESSCDSPGRRLVEDIGRSVKEGIDILKEATGANPVYALSGGQARNDIWNKMKADMTGATFALTETPDGELMGDAVIAFTAIKAYPSIVDAAKNMVRFVKYYESDPAEHARYLEKFATQ